MHESEHSGLDKQLQTSQLSSKQKGFIEGPLLLGSIITSTIIPGIIGYKVAQTHHMPAQAYLLLVPGPLLGALGGAAFSKSASAVGATVSAVVESISFGAGYAIGHYLNQ